MKNALPKQRKNHAVPSISWFASISMKWETADGASRGKPASCERSGRFTFHARKITVRILRSTFAGGQQQRMDTGGISLWWPNAGGPHLLPPAALLPESTDNHRNSW